MSSLPSPNRRPPLAGAPEETATPLSTSYSEFGITDRARDTLFRLFRESGQIEPTILRPDPASPRGRFTDNREEVKSHLRKWFPSHRSELFAHFEGDQLGAELSKPEGVRDLSFANNMLIMELIAGARYEVAGEEFVPYGSPYSVDTDEIYLSFMTSEGGMGDALSDYLRLNRCVLRSFMGARIVWGAKIPHNPQRGEPIADTDSIAMIESAMIGSISDARSGRSELDKMKEVIKGISRFAMNVTAYLGEETLRVHEEIVDSIPIDDTPGANLNQNTQLKSIGLLLAELKRRLAADTGGARELTDLTLDDLYRVVMCSVGSSSSTSSSIELGSSTSSSIESSSIGSSHRPLWSSLKAIAERAGSSPLNWSSLDVITNGKCNSDLRYFEEYRERELEILELVETTDNIYGLNGGTATVEKRLPSETEEEIAAKIALVEASGSYLHQELLDLSRPDRGLSFRLPTRTFESMKTALRVDSLFLHEEARGRYPGADGERLARAGYNVKCVIGELHGERRCSTWVITHPRWSDTILLVGLRTTVLQQLYHPIRTGIDNGRTYALSDLLNHISSGEHFRNLFDSRLAPFPAASKEIRRIIVSNPSSETLPTLLEKGYISRKDAPSERREFLAPFLLERIWLAELSL